MILRRSLNVDRLTESLISHRVYEKWSGNKEHGNDDARNRIEEFDDREIHDSPHNPLPKELFPSENIGEMKSIAG